MARAGHGSAFSTELEKFFPETTGSSNVVPLGYAFPQLSKQSGLKPEESAAICQALRGLGAAMEAQVLDETSDVPAGYTYFGQFVAHDITFFDLRTRKKNAPASCDFVGMTQPLDQQSMAALNNKRTAQLQLDAIYNNAELTDAAHLRVGTVTPTNNSEFAGDPFHDVPRNSNGSTNTDEPQIGDPRNDNNLIVSQLHVAFLRAHNTLVDRLRGTDPPATKHFDGARKLLRQLYHHVLIHDYLPTIADEKIVAEVLKSSKPICDPDSADFCLPLEFIAAAFRFGHAMIRRTYYYNDAIPLISFNALVPRVQMRYQGKPTPTLPANRVIQWKRFIARRDGNIQTDNPNFARPIGTGLVTPLFKVLDEKGEISKCETNLAVMDLLRGHMLGLPTGQAIADELIARCRSIRKLEAHEILAAAGPNQKLRDVLNNPAFGFSQRTPLWFYILAEAQLLGRGKLGPVGSTIIAEVLIALVRRSPAPILPKAGSSEQLFTPFQTTGGEFTLADLLRLGNVL